MSSDKPKVVLVPIESENLKKTIWRRVGSAFNNPNGSMTVLLDAVPLSGKLVIKDDIPRGDQSERS